MIVPSSVNAEVFLLEHSAKFAFVIAFTPVANLIKLTVSNSQQLPMPSLSTESGNEKKDDKGLARFHVLGYIVR